LAEATEGIDRVVIVEENASGLYARELLPLLRHLEVDQLNQVGAMIAPGQVREAVAP
jgi:hypothetical protein